MIFLWNRNSRLSDVSSVRKFTLTTFHHFIEYFFSFLWSVSLERLVEAREVQNFKNN